MGEPKQSCSPTMEGNFCDRPTLFRRHRWRSFADRGLARSQGCAALVAVAGRCLETEIDRPLANALHAVVLAPAPQENLVPPFPFGRFAGWSWFESRSRISRFRLGPEISGRRECSMCLYPAGAG